MTKANSIQLMNTEMADGVSPDILLGAYLVAHLRQICENCGTSETPQWRKGWYSDILRRHITLCNKCGLKYHKNQYCPYCKYVYGKEHDKISDGWLTCQTCGRWVHSACEEKFSKDTSASKGVYSCPGCRGETPKTEQFTSVFGGPSPMQTD